MADEFIRFLAGRDPYGLARWVDGRIVEREHRDDGEWLYVLPAYVVSDEDSAGHWVRADHTRSTGEDAAVTGT